MSARRLGPSSSGRISLMGIMLSLRVHPFGVVREMTMLFCLGLFYHSPMHQPGKLIHSLIPGLLILLAAMQLVCAQKNPGGVDRSADSTAVSALVRERLDAAHAGDTALWHSQVSDSCLFTGPSLANVLTGYVLSVIAANSAIAPLPQRITDLSVRFHDNVAIASYVQLVGDTLRPEREGKRFRKTDTYIRTDSTWSMIEAVEVAIPYRPFITLNDEQSERVCGKFVLPGVDTLTIERVGPGIFLQTSMIGAADTLRAEDDTTLYVEGDPGSWIFPREANGSAKRMIYRVTGAADIVLPRMPERE